MTELRGAPTTKRLAYQTMHVVPNPLSRLILPCQYPVAVLVENLFSITVVPQYERVAPCRGSVDAYIEWLTLEVDDSASRQRSTISSVLTFTH